MNGKRHKFSTGKTLKHIVIFFLLFLAGDLLSSIPFDLLFSVVKLPIRELYTIVRTVGCLLFTYFLFWFYTTRTLHLNMSYFGITFAIKKWGILYAVFLPVFVVIMFLLIGDTVINVFSFSKILLIAAASLLMALKAGILEEILFRGYIMKLLENRWNQYVAVLIPSFLFSLAHIPSMETFSVTGILLLIISGTLAGIMFSLAAYKGNSVSNSVLLHALWNFIMVTDILHITTVQGAYGVPVVSITIPSDHITLTGGGFGVEASVIAIIGYALVCSLLLFFNRNRLETKGSE